MASIGKLVLDMVAKTRTFNADVAKSKKGVKSFGKSARADLKKIGKSFAVMGAAAAVGLALLVKNSIDVAEAAEKVSQRTGVTVEFLTSMAFASELAGSNYETVTNALKRSARTINDASNGLETAARPFRQLGINIKDTTGKLKGVDEIILEVSDKFSKMPDGVKKTALSLEIFGRAGSDLIPLLNAGSAGIAKMQAEAKSLGLVISTKTAKAAAEFKDNLSRLGGAVRGAGNMITERLLPKLEILSKDFVAFIKNDVSFDRFAKAVEASFDIIVTAAELAAGAINLVVQAAEGLGGSSDESTRLRDLRASEEEKLRKLIETGGTRRINIKGNVLEMPIAQFDKQVDDLRRSIAAFTTLINSVEKETEKVIPPIVEVAETIGRLTPRFSDLNRKLAPNAKLWRETATDAELHADIMKGMPSIIGPVTTGIEGLTEGFGDLANTIPEATEPLLDFAKVGENALDKVGNGIEELILKGGSLGQMFKDLAKDILRSFAKLALNKAISSIFGSIFGSLGGSTSSGGSSGGGSGGGFGGAFAHGGIAPAGKVSLVGEEGPELIIPNSPTAVIPNGSFGRSGQTFNVNIDARGADVGAVARIEVSLREFIRQFPNLANASVNSFQLRRA